MQVSELTTDQLSDSIIRAQQYLLNIPQVQQELQVLLQEKSSREQVDNKKGKTK